MTKGNGFGICIALALISCGHDPPSGVLQVGDVADSHGELVRVVACVVRDDATGEDLAWLQPACDAEPTFSLGMSGGRGFDLDYDEFLLDKYEGRTCVIMGRIEPVFEGRSVLMDAMVVTCVPESVRRLQRSNRLDQ